MKEFLRTFFAMLLAGALLIATSFAVFRNMARAEAEDKAAQALVESTTRQLDALDSLAEMATIAKTSERIKTKGDMDAIIRSIITQIEAKPMAYPAELHKRAYSLQLTISAL